MMQTRQSRLLQWLWAALSIVSVRRGHPIVSRATSSLRQRGERHPRCNVGPHRAAPVKASSGPLGKFGTLRLHGAAVQTALDSKYGNVRSRLCATPRPASPHPRRGTWYVTALVGKVTTSLDHHDSEHPLPAADSSVDGKDHAQGACIALPTIRLMLPLRSARQIA